MQSLQKDLRGELADDVADRCVKALINMGRLRRGYARRDTRQLPMLLERPTMGVVGRAAELAAIRKGLEQQRHVLVYGGPGEGKTTLVRSVGGSMFEEDAFPAGTFEVDLTGAHAAGHTAAGSAVVCTRACCLRVGVAHARTSLARANATSVHQLGVTAPLCRLEQWHRRQGGCGRAAGAAAQTCAGEPPCRAAQMSRLLAEM